MKRYLPFFLLPALLWAVDAPAQRSAQATFEQSVDARPYQQKKFRFSGAVKTDAENYPEAEAAIWARVDRANGEYGFFDKMRGRRIRSSRWQTYAIEGTVDADAVRLTVGGMSLWGGRFFFDNFRLEVETAPGRWETIPLQNPGFEEWTAEGKPRGWERGILGEIKNFHASPVDDQPFAGRRALLIASDGYRLGTDHPVKEISAFKRFEHLTTADGLPGDQVICMLQDRQGFIWIGTEKGLARYNGYGFSVFRNDAADSLSLSDDVVTALLEDRSGRLWVGTASGGLNFFDKETERFRRFQYNPEDSLSLSHNYVTTIYEDQTGALWIGTFRGLNRYRWETGQFKRYVAQEGSLFYHLDAEALNPFSLGGHRIMDIEEDRTGALWIAAYGVGIARFDPEKETFSHYYLIDDLPESGASRYIWSIHADQTGRFWLGSENGLYRFDPLSRQFVDRFNQSKSAIPRIDRNGFPRICEEPSGALWVSWLGGVSRFEPSTGLFEAFAFDADNFRGLGAQGFPPSFLIDREGMLWIGTELGLNLLNPVKGKFQGLPDSQPFLREFNNDTITFLLEDREGLLWLGGRQALHRVNLQTGEIGHYVYPRQEEYGFQTGFMNMTEDHAGNLWFSIAEAGLVRFDRTTGVFMRVGTKGINALRHIRSLFEDRSHTLWLGTWGGLYQYEQETETVRSVPVQVIGERDLGGSNITSVFEDKTGALWLGMNNGILKQYDRKKGTTRQYDPSPDIPKVSYGKFNILAIHEDKSGMLWLGTLGDGLIRFDRLANSFTYFREKEGLSGNGVGSILEDDRGRLWITGEKGLTVLDTQTNSIRRYDEKDGFLAGASIRSSRNGLFYFAPEKGLVAFHPDSIRDNPFLPPVVITSLHRYHSDESGGRAIPVPGISGKSSITLSYKNDLLTFEFAALSYTKTAKNEYAYRMEGLSDRWIQLGIRREITFTDLPPGRYTLRIRGSNGDGVWNEEGAVLRIRITPPWYWAGWSKALFLLILLLGFYCLYRLLLHRQLAAAEARRLRELDAVKTNLYTNISHEFRTPLTVILGLAELASVQVAGPVRKSLTLIRRNGRQLLRLVNQMLDLSKLESGKLKLKVVQGDIISYVRYVMESFHSHAQARNVSLDFTAEQGQCIMDYDRKKLLHIISNLLSNAIKFTPQGGRVSLQVGIDTDRNSDRRGGAMGTTNSGKGSDQGQFRTTDRKEKETYFHLTVTDSGIGIPEDQLPHIFERFYQVPIPSPNSSGKIASDQLPHTEGTKGGPGSGIGLALTRELVKLMDGHLTVASTVGKGTEFRVFLPIRRHAPLWAEAEQQWVQEEAKAVSPEPEEAAAMTYLTDTSDTGKPTLLIVEDNQDVIHYLALCLQEEYHLEIARDGQEGIDRALDIVPDLIISDVMMPHKDGFELCRTLKTDERSSHIPIILLTARADMESRLEGLERGADAYLAKPFEAREMLLEVRKLLGLRRRLEEYYRALTTRSTMEKPDQPEELEDLFVYKARTVVETNLPDSEFGVEELCRNLAMSHSQCYRKLMALTGYSPNQFIRLVRLSQARELLKNQELTIAEVAYDTGFTDPAYFSRVFRQEYGMSPSEWRGE